MLSSYFNALKENPDSSLGFLIKWIEQTFITKLSSELLFLLLAMIILFFVGGLGLFFRINFRWTKVKIIIFSLFMVFIYFILAIWRKNLMSCCY